MQLKPQDNSSELADFRKIVQREARPKNLRKRHSYYWCYKLVQPVHMAKALEPSHLFAYLDSACITVVRAKWNCLCVELQIQPQSSIHIQEPESDLVFRASLRPLVVCRAGLDLALCNGIRERRWLLRISPVPCFLVSRRNRR
jgi:hypothetical protein